MKCVEINKSSKDNQKIKEIYFNSFPQYERADFEELIDGRNKDAKFLAYYDGKNLLGFTFLRFAEGIAYLVYLAVDEAKRNQGIGSKILAFLSEKYQNKCLVLNVEFPDIKFTDFDLRSRRKSFYERNGFQSSQFLFDYEGEPFLPLFKGKFEKEKYVEFLVTCFDCYNFRDL